MLRWGKTPCWKSRQRMRKAVLARPMAASGKCQVSDLQEGEIIIQRLQWWDRRCLKHSRGTGREQECWVPLQRTSKGQVDNVSPCWKALDEGVFVWVLSGGRSQNKNQGEDVEEWLYLSRNSRLEFFFFF